MEEGDDDDFWISKVCIVLHVKPHDLSRLICCEQHCGSFVKPISGSQRSDVIQDLQSITCGSEKFKCRNQMSSPGSKPPCFYVPTVNFPYQQHDHLPSFRNHISKLPFPLEAIRCQVTSSWVLFQWAEVQVESRSEWKGNHEYISRRYTDTNQLPSANSFYGETWQKSKGNCDFIWKMLLNVCRRVWPSTLSDCSSRILRSAYILTCIGTYTHVLTHSLGRWENTSKAIFVSSFFRQSFSLPSQFSRSEIDPADSQRGQ